MVKKVKKEKILTPEIESPEVEEAGEEAGEVSKTSKVNKISKAIKIGKGGTSKIRLRKGEKIKVSKDTLKLVERKDIASDFAAKAYAKFDKIIKSIVLFGSTAKEVAEKKSDIDLIIIIDDCTVQWDDELIAWYREELGKLIKENPYKKALHINSVRLSTWWDEMLRGEPVTVNIIRFGEALIDFGGFFNPLKVLLARGKIKNTPETIYIALGRAPSHMIRSKIAMFSAIEGLYWAFVDAAHAALMAAKQVPPSPEHIADMLKEQFVRKKMLDLKFVFWYRDIYTLTHKILRNEIKDVKGSQIDEWRERADIFLRNMAQIVDKLTK